MKRKMSLHKFWGSIIITLGPPPPPQKNRETHWDQTFRDLHSTIRSLNGAAELLKGKILAEIFCATREKEAESDAKCYERGSKSSSILTPLPPTIGNWSKHHQRGVPTLVI